LNVERLTQLEQADYTDQMRACENDAQREILSRRWLRAFNPSKGA
jgi:transposase-like protein